MQQKRWVSVDKILSYALVLACGLLIGYKASSWWPALSENQQTVLSYSGQPSKFAVVNFDIFWKVWDLLEQRYLEPNDFNINKMVDGAVSGLVSALDDPYTMYLPAETKKISEEDLAGSFYGIGVELGYKDKTLAVVAPINDGPAAKLGVQAGDYIMHVKDEKNDVDEDSYDWTLEKAQSVLRGKKGDKVTVSFLRDGYNNNLPFEVEITRDEIVIDSVELEFLEGESGQRYALLTLSRFGERTTQEWNEAAAQIAAQKNQLTGVILDLRNNPGGYFSEAIHVASEFIPKGVIVTQKGRYNSQDFNASGKGQLYNLPLVVLINQGSASSSEIVAGALRDQLGSKLIGEKTFGKGLVQERIDLDSGGGLNVTIAKWMMPAGGWIQDAGLEPDIEATNDAATEVDEVIEIAKQSF